MKMINVIAISLKEGSAFYKKGESFYFINSINKPFKIEKVSYKIIQNAISKHQFDNCILEFTKLNDLISYLNENFIKLNEIKNIYIDSSDIIDLLKYADKKIWKKWLRKANKLIYKERKETGLKIAMAYLNLNNKEFNPKLYNFAQKIIKKSDIYENKKPKKRIQHKYKEILELGIIFRGIPLVHVSSKEIRNNLHDQKMFFGRGIIGINEIVKTLSDISNEFIEAEDFIIVFQQNMIKDKSTSDIENIITYAIIRKKENFEKLIAKKFIPFLKKISNEFIEKYSGTDLIDKSQFYKFESKLQEFLEL